MRDRRAAVSLLFSLSGSFLAGAGLRLWHLRDQVMGGDELHAVRVAAHRTMLQILTTYHLADASIPLTALARWLMERGLTLGEVSFRLPALLCGLAALLAIPWAFRKKLEPVEVLLLGWLVAFSPGLVLYSRIARSYMPMVLAGFGAVMAFELWWRTRRWRAAVAYVLLAGLAVWLHLGAAPLVAAPFLFALADLVPPRREGRWKGLLALAVLATTLAVALALFLLPARASLGPLVAAKRHAQTVPLASVFDMLQLQAGTGSGLLAVVFWTIALAGLALLLGDRPRLGAYTLTVVVGHAAGLAFLAPVGMANPVVLNRYLLPVLPFVLLWVAHALGRPWVAGGGCFETAAQRYGARFFVLLLLWAGPLRQAAFRESSFLHHNDFVSFYAPLATLDAQAVPGFYRQLDDLPGGPVIEYPWPTEWRFGRSFSAYQRLHGRRVLVSAPFDMPRDPRLAFRNEVAPEPAALLASPARYLIVHLRLPEEEARVSLSPERFPEAPMNAQDRRRYRRAGVQLAQRLARDWGPPDVAEGGIRVWDLERVRQEGPGAPATTAPPDRER